MAGIEISSITHVCFKCGEGFGRKKGNFFVSHSFLHKGSGYMPYCMKCVDAMYSSYLREAPSAKDAVRQMCRKLDIYWKQSIFDGVEKTAATRSMMTDYISKVNSVKFAGKCYDDTLREEAMLWCSNDEALRLTKTAVTETEFSAVEVEIDPDIQSFWGSGFHWSFYDELERRYKNWTAGLNTIDTAEQAIYKQICILEATITRDSAAGKPIDKNVNALNSLLGSANLKPSQKKGEDLDAELENMPFGVGIRRWENTRPIPEPDPELRDVDGIIKYITIWFFGHLCKMLGIKNSYCKLYDEELERLKVRNPEFEDDDDESLFNNIFGGESS